MERERERTLPTLQERQEITYWNIALLSRFTIEERKRFNFSHFSYMKEVPPPETNQKKAPPRSTLGSYLRYFHDTPLKVELKNGRILQGTLVSVDDSMNLELRQSTSTTTDHPKKDNNLQQTLEPEHNSKPPAACHFLSSYIRGSTIRYIHFPSTTHITFQVQEGLARDRRAKQKYQRGIRK